MFWDSIFGINTAQGLFIMSVFIYRRHKNPSAIWLLFSMVFIMVITNFGYLVIRTNLVNLIPQAYLIPFGTIFLLGPLFYFYVKSVTDNSFHWKKKYFLNFLPYLVQIAFYFPVYFTTKESIIEFIYTFLSGNLPVNSSALILLAVQIIHFMSYIYLSGRLVYLTNKKHGNNYIIPAHLRYKWLRELLFLFILLSVTISGLYIYVLINGKYNPITNYIYTIISTGIIYFISYNLVFKPDLINPDFTVKYKSLKPLESPEETGLLRTLHDLMENEKIYLNPELKLSVLAERTGTLPHQLSRIINTKHNKTYNDFINEYRVNEFITRLNDHKYKSYSIYGLALEVGFNSKSSFNAAFKKITGKNPSDFKK